MSLRASLRRSLNASSRSSFMARTPTRASESDDDDDDEEEEEDREEIYDENEEYEYGDEKRKEGIRAAAVLATLEFAPLEPADVLSSDEEEPEQAEKMEKVLDRIRSLRRRKEAAAKAFADDDSDSGAAAAPAQPARSGRRGTGIFRTGRKLIKSLRLPEASEGRRPSF